MSATLRIKQRQFGKLLQVAVKQRGGIEVKSPSVCGAIAKEYFKMMFNSVIDKPVSHSFQSHGISHVQVLEKQSRKGYEWDRKYNGKDYELLIIHDYPYAEITIDSAFTKKVLRKAEAGMLYQDEISNPVKALKEIYKQMK